MTNNLNSKTWASLEWMKYSYSFGDSMLADFFKEAGDKIINDLKRRKYGKHAEMYFMPIAYLYRHSLELKMKEIIGVLLKLGLIKKNAELTAFLEKHSLEPLWRYIKPSLIKRWPNSSNDDLNFAQQAIQFFHRMDVTGQALRYTKDKKGKSTLKSLPPSVDLIQFKEILGEVYSFLDGCEMAFEHDWETKCEIESYYSF